jgi:hypothetical protein
MSERGHSERLIRINSQQDVDKIIDERQEEKVDKVKEMYEFSGFIVQNGDDKVLVEEDDKDHMFPHLKGIRVRQKLTVKYIGSLTLAELLAKKIFHNTKRIVKNGQELLLIKD